MPGARNFLILSVLVASISPLFEATVDEWTVQIVGGTNEANRVASEHGFNNLGLIPGLADVYLFKRSADTELGGRHKRSLSMHPNVGWADPQVPLVRVKRDGGRTINDELWIHQWYLQESPNEAQRLSDIDLKVEEVWAMGYTGKGVIVSVLDDGLEHNHTDIKPNYDPIASWDYNNNISDPFPRYSLSDDNSHGTRCAGEIAMVKGNQKCGVGVAPDAKVGGIKCLDGKVWDRVEYLSLTHRYDHVDIYSGSWGPDDKGAVVEGPSRLANEALAMGCRIGRQGKGSIYVWANGNGGPYGDNCNCDGYVSSIYTISIGGVTQHGRLPYYGERCSSTLAVTPSSGFLTDRKIVTTDLFNKCTIEYTGTSAAAPLAAGIYALALEANPQLSWRDVQHLTAWTSDAIPLRDNPGWKRNAAGLYFNSRFGFGLMNAKQIVQAALAWKTVPSKSLCIVTPITRPPVFLHSGRLAQLTFQSDGCQSLSQRSRIGPVLFLEHVQVIVDIEYSRRGALDIFLVSPSGTISTLLTRRPFDRSRAGFDKWPLMSVHFWSESSVGQWRLIVRDKNSPNNRGVLRNATLVLHGTSHRPAHLIHGPRKYPQEDEVAPFLDPVLEFDEVDDYDLNNFPNELALARDDTYESNFAKSLIARELADSESQRS